MPLKVIKLYVNNLRRYSTPIGCVWYFVTFVFRFIVVSPVGKNVYADGMKEFMVNCITSLSVSQKLYCYPELDLQLNIPFYTQFDMKFNIQHLVGLYSTNNFFANPGNQNRIFEKVG